MVVRIVISGEKQCESFAEVCLIADYLSRNLPEFCYERIEKSIYEWKTWLSKINLKHKWHHEGSPVIWKELLMKGSKPYYIGGASEFVEYCHSYYSFDLFVSPPKFHGLIKKYSQFQEKVKQDKQAVSKQAAMNFSFEETPQKDFIVCISGASCPLTMNLVAELLEMSNGERSISKIFVYDEKCSQAFMELVERECSFIGSRYPGKVVKYVDKIGIALTQSDLLIIMDHVPFNIESTMGDWLHANMDIMHKMSLMINASASRKMYILFPNLGPACFNATVLMKSVTRNVHKRNIVVATSDLALDIVPIIAEIAEIPVRYMFCPPVWGFVGVNQLVDVRTTVHKYNTFKPYDRYTKVRNSTLNIGSVSPQMRTLEYLMHFDETLWVKAAERKKCIPEGQLSLNKAIAVLNVVKTWLLDPNPDYVVNLGILCDGSFGLTFDGVFSQPAQFVDNEWKPANGYMIPKDPQMKLPYLQYIAEMMLRLEKKDLPKIDSYTPCSCKTKYVRRKHVW